MDKKNKPILTNLQKLQKRREYMRDYYLKNKNRIYRYHKKRSYNKKPKNDKKPYFTIKRGNFIVTFD